MNIMNTMTKQEELKVFGGRALSREEVAELFRVSPSTVTRWAREGKIPVHRTPGGHYRYLETELKKLASGFLSGNGGSEGE
jgi:excisionase family DNA binding protein